MIITYQGLEFFKISQGDLTIAINPPSKKSKYKSTKFGADIALVSVNQEDFNGAEDMNRGDKMPFVINGPGEYEIKDVFVQGLPGESEYAGDDKKQVGKKRINTIYKISLEGMELCFLGAQSKAEIPKESLEALDNIDILFVPIGGEGVLEAGPAYKLAVSLEPKLIIPMHFGEDINSAALKTFIKEGGKQASQAEDKLTIKKKDIEGRDGEIVVLKPQM